ncbi:MAG: glycosyltransferase [Cryobacterium sp.]|uniref:glycosyltransferase n=1 Tax=unclassified Cryobacterium TaxID=2649013 RepID=UPI001A334554|nr:MULTISPECIES: glycosyltransferase [unclassified Cryobacterium]MCY7404317.1 glycosyltransferase [Cryobacterium sp.]MEC5154608.1 D-inositol-3-phosphate glycosyltransferase [Cryobacterium sp. CAN_C3]
MLPLEKSLRIALVCLHTSPGADPGAGDAGGMNVVVRHQAEALAALGHDVSILTRRSAADQPASMQLAPAVTLQFLDAGPAVTLPKGQHEHWIEKFSARLAALPPYDIIHSHHWFSGMAALPVARRWGIPHVQSFHSIAADNTTPLSAGERAESPGRMLGEAWLARESDSVVAISAAESATITGRLGGAAQRTAVVLPGVDSGMFSPAGHADRVIPAGSGGYVLVAARLQPLKGLDLAIAAIAAIPAGIRPALVIAGAASADYDGYVDELRALAERVGLTDELRLVGPRSRVDLASLFRGARLVLVPSHSETYGLVALEGAASGVPVIAAASGGLREAVVDGATGLVLESRDPRVWGDAIARLLTDPQRARRLSVAAREHAVQLDWTRSATSLLKVYRELLAPGTPDHGLAGSCQHHRAVA